MTPDFVAMLSALSAEGAEFMLVGAHALAALAEADLLDPDVIYQVGVEPNRIDLMNDISGVSWAEAWAGRTEITVEGLRVPVLGLEEFVRNKRASGRPKDRADLIRG